jgi:hypothetical protein
MVPPWLPLLALHLAAAREAEPAQEGPPPSSSEFSGDVTLGWRFVDVDGNRDQYDEDLNLDSGFVLRELRLEGRRKRGASEFDSYLLRVYGVGDPQTSALAQVTGSALQATGTYTRTTFEGKAEDDLHPFDFERERASLRVESTRDVPNDAHAGVEVSASRRNGIGVGTRATRVGYIGGGNVQQDDETLGARADVGFDAFGLSFEIEGGVQGLQSRDHREFSAPSPVDPTFTQTDSFRAEVDSTAVDLGARARHKFDGGKLAADLGFEYSEITGNGVMHDDETALFAPGDPFRLTTDAQSDLLDRWFEADAGLRRQVSPDLAWRLRFEHVDEESGGSVVTDTLLEEPPGSPPSALTQQQSLFFESEVQLVELGLETAISSSADLDLAVEGGIDHETVRDVTDGVTTSLFDDDLEQFGARASLAMEASLKTSFTLEAGYELAPTHDPVGQTLFSLEDERGAFAAARVRWRPGPGIAWTGSLKHREREVEAFGSRYASNSLSVSGSFAPSARWSADAAYSMRLYDLEADTFVVLLDGGPVQTPATVSFQGVQNVLSGSVSYEIARVLRPRLGASAVATTGDAEVRYGSLLLDLPWKLESDLTLGAEVDLHHFDSRGDSPGDDYDSSALLLYVKVGF